MANHPTRALAASVGTCLLALTALTRPGDDCVQCGPHAAEMNATFVVGR